MTTIQVVTIETIRYQIYQIGIRNPYPNYNPYSRDHYPNHELNSNVELVIFQRNPNGLCFSFLFFLNGVSYDVAMCAIWIKTRVISVQNARFPSQQCDVEKTSVQSNLVMCFFQPALSVRNQCCRTFISVSYSYHSQSRFSLSFFHSFTSSISMSYLQGHYLARQHVATLSHSLHILYITCLKI